MSIEVRNRHFYSAHSEFDLEKYPKKCPMCHTAISIIPYTDLGNVINANNEYDTRYDGHTIQAIFRCPECNKLFISTYAKKYQAGEQFWLMRSDPYSPEKIDFGKEIKELSPDFTKIYQQSHTAESTGLDQIAGCGYRKSLEFLIKDYCIKFLQKDTETVAKKFLVNCIDDDLDSQEIKDCAKRAAWLGNDESHYTKKWEKHDIQSLKDLIGLTQSWITTKMRTKKYKEDMK